MSIYHHRYPLSVRRHRYSMGIIHPATPVYNPGKVQQLLGRLKLLGHLKLLLTSLAWPRGPVQHTTAHCNAVLCNALQHIATHCNTFLMSLAWPQGLLQHTAAHYLILVAFITGNSSLEPLIEGLYAQIHVNLR